MTDSFDDIERDARDMIRQFGTEAQRIAHLRAEIAENNIGNPRLARTWREIADAIERLSVIPSSP